LSEKPIQAKFINSLWLHGNDWDFRIYDPDYGEKRYGDPSRNAVNYIFDKPKEHLSLLDYHHSPFCHGKRGCKHGCSILIQERLGLMKRCPRVLLLAS